MTTFSTKIGLLGLFLFLFQSIQAQEDLIVYWQPKIALNYKVSENYYHNFSISNRNFIYRDEVDFSGRHLELSHFSKLKIRDNQSLSLGILWRCLEIFDDDSVNEIRLTEQYNINSRANVIRFGYRFRAEQRFNSIRNIYRFRNRIALDFPLQGETLDIGESYFLGSLENVLSVAQSLEPFHALRFRGGLGWQLSQKSKLQFVLQYRLNNLTRNAFHVLLLETTLILGL